MGTYDSMTNEEFDSILDEVVQSHGLTVVMSIPGVDELVREYFNNEVLEVWESKMSGTEVISIPGSDVLHIIGEEYCLDDKDEDGLYYLSTLCGKEVLGELLYRKDPTCKSCLKIGESHGS